MVLVKNTLHVNLSFLKDKHLLHSLLYGLCELENVTGDSLHLEERSASYVRKQALLKQLGVGL